MAETIETTLSDQNKQKKILSLKMLDEVKNLDENLSYELTTWNASSFRILKWGSGNNYDVIYNESDRDYIEDAVLANNVWVNTWLGFWTYEYKLSVSNPKTISTKKCYIYNGKRILQLGNSRIMIDWQKLKVLSSDWCHTQKLGLHMLGITNNGEIILKKYKHNRSDLRFSASSPYTTLPWTKIVQLDSNGQVFYVINDGNIDKVNVTIDGDLGNPIKCSHLETLSFEQFWEIQQVQTDNNKNFVLMIWKKWGKSCLYILKHSNWTEWEVVATIDGVIETIVLPDNTLLCVMEDWTLKKVSTTFNQFERWFFEQGWDVVMREDSIKTVRNNAYEQMLEAMKSAKLDEDWELKWDDLDISEQDVISEFWSKRIEGGNKTIRELFEEAQTQEDIRRVEGLVNKVLVSISSFTWGVKIKNHIKDIIMKKKEEIVLHNFQKDIDSAQETLNKADNLQDLINAKTVIMDLHERRKNIHGSPLTIDLWKKIKEMIKVVEEKITEYQEEWKDDILAHIKKNIEELKLYIDAISYGADLSQIYNLDIRKETMNLIEYLGEEEKKKQKKELLSLVSQRSSEIVKEEKKEVEKKELEIIRSKNEINEEIDILIGMLETVHTIESVNEMKETDALAKKIESEIADLPASVSWELEIKYNKAFKSRIFHIRRENIKERGIVQNLDESWIDTMLYYVDTEKKSVSWKLIGTPTSQWLIKLGISLDDGKRQYTWDNFFEDSDKFADVIIWDDIEFEITQSEFIKLNKQIEEWKKYGKPELNKLIQNLSEENDAEKKGSILKEIKDIKSQYKKARYVEKLANRLIEKEKRNPRSYVPEINHNYVVLDEEKEIFKEVSWKLLSQKKRSGSGITVLKWGPWLWKTVMCEYLAAVTNREIVRVQCSKKISYSEFFFAPTLKKGETSSSPAEWIKMMQKPWTIILFDEIDKLNADCLAWLHALFDGWRHVHDPQLWDFHANPDCLFLGTMNAYEPLPKAIASRATFQEISYPSEENEAYKISKYADNDLLNGLTFEEFKELWNDRIIKERKTKGEKEHKLNELLDNIKKLLEVFKILRGKYEDDYEKFEYELSYRDAAQVFDAYAVNNNFKKSLRDVLVSDADSVVWVEDKKEQREMVIEAIDRVFWW